MRYPFILLVVVLVACTVPPDGPKSEAAVADSKPVDPRPVVPKIAPKVPAITEVPPSKEQCANIKTGDVKDDIHLKLDCLLSPTKEK